MYANITNFYKMSIYVATTARPDAGKKSCLILSEKILQRLNKRLNQRNKDFKISF